MRKHTAFTMIELIFVIVIMGIIGKFGVEFLAQAYRSFIFASINNELQSTSANAVELIAARLEHRIKDSVIARTAVGATPIPIGSANGNYTVLEWIGANNEGMRGSYSSSKSMYLPDWSGIVDLDNASATSSILVSPETNTSAISSEISSLSNAYTNITQAALYFVGSNSDAKVDYGWDGDITYMRSQEAAMHPVTSNGTPNQFVPSIDDFSTIDVYEYYKLAWTAYAIVYEAGANNMGKLKLYWDYQPWLDRDSSGFSDQLNNGPFVKSEIIMENVSSFRFIAIGSIMKIQVCTKTDVIEDYSLCKEKTVF